MLHNPVLYAANCQIIDAARFARLVQSPAAATSHRAGAEPAAALLPGGLAGLFAGTDEMSMDFDSLCAAAIDPAAVYIAPEARRDAHRDAVIGRIDDEAAPCVTLVDLLAESGGVACEAPLLPAAATGYGQVIAFDQGITAAAPVTQENRAEVWQARAA